MGIRLFDRDDGGQVLRRDVPNPHGVDKGSINEQAEDYFTEETTPARGDRYVF